MLRRLLQKSSRYFLWMLFAKVASTGAFIVFGRILGTSKFGEFLYFLAMVQLITILTDMGTTHWQQRQDQETQSFSRAFALRLTAMVVAIPCIIIASTILGIPWTTLVVLLAALFSELLLSVTDGYFLAATRGEMLSYKVISKTLLTLLSFFLLGYPSVTGALIAYTLGNLATALWSFPWKLLQEPPKISQILPTLKGSYPYAFLMVTSFTYSRADSLIVGSFAGSNALGIYGAAYRYLEGVSLLPTALGQVLFPLSARGQLPSKSQVVKLLAVSGLAGSLIMGALFFGAPLLTQGIFGIEYASGAGVLRVLSIVAFLFFLNAPLATLIQSSAKIQSFLPWGILNTVGNVILNLILVPQFGAVGAAYAMLATEMTGFLINCFFIRSVLAPSKTV